LMPDPLEPAVSIRVASIEDLVRLATSMASRFIVMPIYRFKEGGVVYYFIQASYKDYYKQYGVPVLYYYSRPLDEDVDDSKAKYVIAKADEMGEKVEITDRIKHGYTAVPIVNLAERPAYFKTSQA